jgi:hypothetical protein
MKGGGSIGRFNTDRLNDKPLSIFICDIGRYCLDGSVTSDMDQNLMPLESFISNNVNGPGSGNLRVHPFVITTSATDFREVQVINTKAKDGQTLAGGFKLHFKGLKTI